MMPSRRRQKGEGSLFRRARDGRWVATVNDGWRDGKRDRRLFTGRSPEIALKKRTAFLRARDEGFDLPRGRPLNTDEWLEHWLCNIARPRVEATTWERSYRAKVRLLIAPYFAGIPLPQLREEDIERWHRQLEVKASARTGEPVSASTIGQAHRIFSAALKVAVQRGKMPRNPCSFVTPPRVDRPEAEPPTAEEIAVIVARCATWPNGARWVLAISTGLRQGEALALRWRDLRLDGQASMTISRTAARVGHKLVYKVPKSAKSRRTVELPGAAADALREHRRSQAVADVGGLVFVTARGAPWHPRQDWQDWQDLLADLGLPHYRVHDLRHAAATMLLEGGEDVRVVQELLGHATPAFTQAAYQHVRPVLKRHAAATMDRLLRGG